MWNCPPRHLTVTIVLHHITMMQKIAIDPFDKNLSRTNQISLFARKLNENAFYIADWKWRNKKGGGGGGNQASQCQFLWLYYPCLNAIYVEPDFPPTRQKTEYLSNREKYTAFFTPLYCIIFRFESVVVNRSFSSLHATRILSDFSDSSPVFLCIPDWVRGVWELSVFFNENPQWPTLGSNILLPSL